MITIRAITARFLFRDIEDRELRSIARALHALPKLPCEVFRLFRFADLSCQQIAAQLGIDEDAVVRNFTIAMLAIDDAANRQQEKAERALQRYRRCRRATRVLRKALNSIRERLES